MTPAAIEPATFRFVAQHLNPNYSQCLAKITSLAEQWASVHPRALFNCTPWWWFLREPKHVGATFI